ncbi:hypothetical protein ACU5CE_08020 [Priestia megaterium]
MGNSIFTTGWIFYPIDRHVLSPKNKGELAPIDVPLKVNKDESQEKQQVQYKMYETNNLVIPYAGRWQIAVRLVTSNLDEIVIYKDIVVYDVK